MVEDTETFLAQLSSSDNFVLVGQDLADVLIQDNDGNLCEAFSWKRYNIKLVTMCLNYVLVIMQGG